jgi:hypothetical protein
MNVDRMRRALERAEAARDEQDRQQWLAKMTPELRALVERPEPFICDFCLAWIEEWKRAAAIQGVSQVR